MSNDDTYKEIFEVVGDARDPAGVDPSARGVGLSHDFTKHAGKPLIWCELGGTAMPMTWDVFPGAPGEPAWIQGLCPSCVASHPPEHAGMFGLTIKQDQKPFEYRPDAAVPPFPGFSRREMAQVPRGRLTIEEPIRCDRCGWHVHIVDNVARPVR